MYDLSRWVIRFQESEVPKIKFENLPTQELILKHSKAISLLEGIEGLKRRKESCIEAINGLYGTFPVLRAKGVRKVDTLNRAISRLEQSYLNLIK